MCSPSVLLSAMKTTLFRPTVLYSSDLNFLMVHYSYKVHPFADKACITNHLLGRIVSCWRTQNRFFCTVCSHLTSFNMSHCVECAEWNSRRSRILAAANIRVAHAHVNKPRAQMAISNEYMIGTRTHAVQRSSTIFEARRAIIVWNHWKKTRKRIGSAV